MTQKFNKPGTLFYFQNVFDEEEIIMLIKSEYKPGTIMYFVGQGDTIEVPYQFSHTFLNSAGEEKKFISVSEDPNDPPVNHKHFKIAKTYQLIKCQF